MGPSGHLQYNVRNAKIDKLINYLTESFAMYIW